MEQLRVRVGSALHFKWRRTLHWSSRVAGERVSGGTLLEMVTAESLSALPGGQAVEAPEGKERRVFAVAGAPAAGGALPRPPPSLEDLEGAVENADGAAEPVPAPLPAFLQRLLEGLARIDAEALDTRLRRAVRLEQRLDAEIARLLRQVTGSGVGYTWRERPCTLARFAREKLGMSPRKARALLRLERIGDACPELRQAFREGSLSWAQAQLLAPLFVGDVDTSWHAAWVAFAGRVTVRRLEEAVGHGLALREGDPGLWQQCRHDPDGAGAREEEAARAARAADERQTCARPTDLPGDLLGPITLRITAPKDVARLFRAVLCSLQRRMPRAREADAFEAMLDHALDTWGVHRRAPRRFEVFERDGWRCTIPGCTSYRNLHDHHIRFRSAGGSDAPENRTTLCAAHHLRGVHAGIIRITGRAPDALCFEMPLARYRSGDRIQP